MSKLDLQLPLRGRTNSIAAFCPSKKTLLKEACQWQGLGAAHWVPGPNGDSG